MTPHMKKLIAIACVSLACAAPSARIARVGAAGGGTAAAAPSMQTPTAPGALAFASERYGVTEAAGSAKIRVRRTGGTDGEVSGKVTLTDVTTSPADYRFAPGARDASFNQGGSGANNYVWATAVQPDGKILIGGTFTAYNGDESAPDGVMRLNADGTRDMTFNPGGSGVNNYGFAVFETVVQPDGKIIIGGLFSVYNGESAPSGVMRLNADGTRDMTFNLGGSGLNGDASEIMVQPDGKILIGGTFTAYNGASAPSAVMRLNADGTRDASFNQGGSGLNYDVTAMAVQPDGKILIGGDTRFYNGASVPYGVMRLNADGTRDLTFNPGGSGLDSIVSAMMVQPDGKILIGGGFSFYNGAPVPICLMRLNADGTRDASFNPGGSGAKGNVFAMVVQPDGKLIIGGLFSAYNDDESASDRVMRLNADGTRDPTFNPGGTGASGEVFDVALQPDGKIIIGGRLIAYNDDESAPDNVMRLDGDLFVTWRPGDAAEKVVHLPIVDDGIAEPDETLTLTLSVVSGGAALGPPSSATLTIGGPANPIDDNRNFVRQHYYDFLSREPDADGLAFWTNQMTNCGNPNLEVCRVNVSAAFFQAIEFQQTAYFVERMYKAAYGDAAGTSTLGGAHQLSVPVVRFNDFLPDAQAVGRDVIVGVGDWERLLESNKQAFALEFVQRPAFLARYPSTVGAEEFLNSLDQNAGGVLTDAERVALVAELSPSHSDPALRASVLRRVAEHPDLVRRERNRAFVLMQYFGYLRRDPDGAPDADHTGYDFWLRKLEGFGGDFVAAEMVKAFITSEEYRRRFAQ